MVVQFGDFTLDPGAMELRGRDGPVHLTPKAMELLVALVEARPRVLARRELFDRLWPDVVVEEANLKNLVADLRRALGDRGRRGGFIRTIHGRGYAFAAGTAEPGSSPDGVPAQCVVLFHERGRVTLRAVASVIGRGAAADVVLDDPEVSRRHARIVISAGRVTIEDIASKNGTFVGGSRVEAVTEIRDGDEIRLGRAPLTVRIGPAGENTRTAD